MSIENLVSDSLQLLKDLIKIPSLSKQEDQSAGLLKRFFENKSVPVHQSGNNVWVFNKNFNPALPTILLNSHHDTVKPNASYTLNPFSPIEKEGKLFGLGSNDAGGCLVSLIAAFLFFYEKEDLKFNLVFAGTAEEEISGANGIASVIPQLPEIHFAIVGEPTEMNLAVAEKGLMVVDCYAKGIAGHAARNEGVNAIYVALKDLEWIKSYQFPRSSEWLGPVKMQVTIINAGSQHNVVPDSCNFTIDVRTTDSFTNEEVLDLIKQNLAATVVPRSTRLQPTFIDVNHPFIVKGIELGMKPFGSPTLSDQALLKCPSVKIGPGKSERSHTADEYIYISEIENGIEKYVEWISSFI